MGVALRPALQLHSQLVGFYCCQLLFSGPLIILLEPPCWDLKACQSQDGCNSLCSHLSPSSICYGKGCDNYYNGEVMPCLMRPWLPPFSYSTTEGNNGEYKRRRRAARTWRAI